MTEHLLTTHRELRPASPPLPPRSWVRLPPDPLAEIATAIVSLRAASMMLREDGRTRTGEWLDGVADTLGDWATHLSPPRVEAPEPAPRHLRDPHDIIG